MKKNLIWDEFQTETFIFCERNARIIYPNCEANGKIILKTEYWDAFPNVEIAMLKKGYTWCNISHQTRWAPDFETEIMSDFVKFVAKKLGFEEKCIPIGMSCGGLQAARLAQLYPKMVEAMYLDAPVLNILSMAGLGACECGSSFWREIASTYGVNKSSIVNFRKSPIDEMDILTDNKIPVIMLYGNADDVVIYEENGKVLEEHYIKKGVPIKVISRSMAGHHPHGLDDATPIIDFIEKHI